MNNPSIWTCKPEGQLVKWQHIINPAEISPSAAYLHICMSGMNNNTTLNPRSGTADEIQLSRRASIRYWPTHLGTCYIEGKENKRHQVSILPTMEYIKKLVQIYLLVTISIPTCSEELHIWKVCESKPIHIDNWTQECSQQDLMQGTESPCCHDQKLWNEKDTHQHIIS